MIDNLDVFIWGCKVGTLVSSKIGYKKQICFYFDPQYARNGFDIAPLRSPITGPAALAGLPVYPEESKDFGGLPSFIADSLPDYWGNVVFFEWAKAHNIPQKSLSALDRLAYIGQRGMGALEFLPPASAELHTPFRVEISELSELAQKTLHDAKDFHAVLTPGLAIESLFKVGTSAGGRRPKAVINVNDLTGECYSGQVPAPLPGFRPSIIKFDEHSSVPTTRIEFSYYLMGVEAGLKMMPSKIIELGNESHFLTERFDRNNNEKIHVQSLAAMNPLSSSYEELFDVALKLDVSPDESRLLFLQMVMNVIAGNIDDHNKNFSFMMGKDGVWHISPAYDFTFTVDTSGPFYVNRHSMSINGKIQDISKKDMLEIAARFNIKGASSIIEKAIATAGDFRKFAGQAGLSDLWIQNIEREIRSRISAL